MLSALISIIGTFLFDWWGWVLVVGSIGYLLWQNKRKIKWLEKTDYQLLQLEIPKANDKKELAAEQLFASLHGILRPRGEIIKSGILQEHVSFEIASIGKLIRFYVWTPKHLRDFVEGQIYAQYPGVNIVELDEDYSDRNLADREIYSTELTLNTSDVIPIKTFPSFEVDPLAAITATLSKLDEENEELWIQILARPLDDSWHQRGASAVKRIKAGGSISGMRASNGLSKAISLFIEALRALFKPPEQKAIELSDRQRAQISAIEEKSNKLGYDVKVRLLYTGPQAELARLRLQAIVGTFKQFNSTNLNGFKMTKQKTSEEAKTEYRARYFPKSGYTLNIEELASLWHLPHTNVETPNIVWRSTKTAEPPSTLPTIENTEDAYLSLFGATNFRSRHVQFGIKRWDRDRHMYVIGQTGTGKSGLLKLLTLSDVFRGQGIGIVDPHGDYAQSILSYIPKHRLEDVIYFNPSDTANPIAFNPLEVTDPSLKNHISSELVGVLKRMFESWGPRLEYILRFTILALLDYPSATMLDITRMLTEKNFRAQVVKHIDDPVVKQFWTQEFASWNEKFASEAVAPVLNKVGAFTANPMIRNIIGQPKSTINMRKAMDEGKILIVNLSRGLVGEDNAAVLGALVITKIQLAAMSRADSAEDNRRPFYLYVDEFQNFATDSFAVILSEARKYGLNLTLANQYISQMTPDVRDAVFGNVGSFIFFRVGADDATVLTKYVSPQFEAQDLMNLHNRHFVAGLTIDGEKTQPFSGTTLNIPAPENDFTANIIENSRRIFSKTKEEVEHAIRKRIAEQQSSIAGGSPHHNRPRQHPNSSKRSVKKAVNHQGHSFRDSQTQTNQNPREQGELAHDEEITFR